MVKTSAARRANRYDKYPALKLQRNRNAAWNFESNIEPRRIINAGILICGVSLGYIVFSCISRGLLIAFCFFVLGVFVLLRGVDRYLLSYGLKRLLPSSVTKFIERKDLARLWIDFLREYNPIVLFTKLSGKNQLWYLSLALKLFDLDREESAILLTGSRLSTTAETTVLSVIPELLRSRYDPLFASPIVRKNRTESELKLLQVIYQIVKHRARKRLNRNSLLNKKYSTIAILVALLILIRRSRISLSQTDITLKLAGLLCFGIVFRRIMNWS